MFEKATRLQESMRMMGLSDTAYWISYFISDGIILGFIVSMFCCILSTYGLFNQGNFGEIFALLFLFCIAASPFGFFLCSFFDTPQTAGQVTLGILLGMLFCMSLLIPPLPVRFVCDLHRLGAPHCLHSSPNILLFDSAMRTSNWLCIISWFVWRTLTWLHLRTLGLLRVSALLTSPPYML